MRKAPIACIFPLPNSLFLKSLPIDTYVLSSIPILKPSPLFIPDNSFFIGTFAVYILSMRNDENPLYKEFVTISILKKD